MKTCEGDSDLEQRYKSLVNIHLKFIYTCDYFDQSWVQ